MVRRLQDSILSLLIHLTILFNIERLDIYQKNVIDLETAIYILTVIAVIMILSIKWLKMLRQPILIALWTGIYFIVKLMLLPHRPLVGGIYTYLSFTELGLFIVAVFLAQNLSLNIQDFEKAIENFAFANIRKIKRIQEAQEEIKAELYRSRRFQRPLSIIVLQQDSKNVQRIINKVAQEAQRAMLEQYVYVMIARELTTKLRQTDLLFENDKKGRLVILSPDTDTNETETLISRLGALTQSIDFSINFGAATFPDHALTFEQLLEHAELNLQQRINRRINIDTFDEV
jgi:hypothetical protein